MRPILLPGPTEPRFYVLLWGSILAGVVGLLFLLGGRRWFT